jgi:hypothetical protein
MLERWAHAAIGVHTIAPMNRSREQRADKVGSRWIIGNSSADVRKIELTALVRPSEFVIPSHDEAYAALPIWFQALGAARRRW